MTWARFDDKFHSHPKALRAGLAGCGLFLRAVTYSCDHLTDGHVPEEWVATQLGAADSNVPDRMVSAGLWRECPGGYEILDFLDFNPSREQVLAKRRQRAEAGRAGGLKKSANARQGANADSNAEPLAARQPLAKGSPPALLSTLPTPQEAGVGVREVLDILARGKFDPGDPQDDAAVLAAMEARPHIDPAGAARVAVDWSHGDGWRTSSAVQSFRAAMRALDRDQQRDKDKPKQAAMVPGRRECIDCGTEIKSGSRCRDCDRKLEEKLTGGVAA